MGAPKPPDPVATARAQGIENRSAAVSSQLVNMVDQSGPDGSQTYSRTGDQTYTDENGKVITIPKFRLDTTLSPEQQKIYDANRDAQGNLAGIARDRTDWLSGYLNKSMDMSNLPQLGAPRLNGTASAPTLATTYDDGYGADRQKVEDALMARMNPKLEQDRNRLETDLANRGIRIGSQAYNDAMDGYGRQTNDARLAAILGAGQEQSRLVGLSRDRASFGNDATQANFANAMRATEFGNQTALNETDAAARIRDQLFREGITTRNQPLNEITALLSGSQVTMPQQLSTPRANVAAAPIADLIMKNYEQKAQQNNAMWGGIGSIAGAGLNLLMSDKRAKTDIKRVGELDNGLAVYRYRYKDGGPMQIGVMAQDVEKRDPAAVAEIGGFKAVDYRRATS